MKPVFSSNHTYIISPHAGEGIILGGEASAAFDAAALQDLAAIFSTIALHEAMFDFALAFMRLISSLWHKINLSIKISKYLS